MPRGVNLTLLVTPLAAPSRSALSPPPVAWVAAERCEPTLRNETWEANIRDGWAGIDASSADDDSSEELLLPDRAGGRATLGARLVACACTLPVAAEAAGKRLEVAAVGVRGVVVRGVGAAAGLLCAAEKTARGRGVWGIVRTGAQDTSLSLSWPSAACEWTGGAVLNLLAVAASEAAAPGPTERCDATAARLAAAEAVATERAVTDFAMLPTGAGKAGALEAAG